MGEIQVVVFSLNNQFCGVDTSQVQEIVKYQNVAKIPDIPEFIEGVTNLRGKVIPVINLNKRFDLGETEVNSKTKIIITLVNGSLVGFTVNDVSEILKFSDENIENTPAVVLNKTNKYLKSIGKKDGKLISILDLSKVLTKNEIQKLPE